LFRPQGYLPGQSKTNLKGQINAITLRSGKDLESPQMPIREDRGEVNNEDDIEKEVLTKVPSETTQSEKTKEVQAEHVLSPVRFYKPLVPYP